MEENMAYEEMCTKLREGTEKFIHELVPSEHAPQIVTGAIVIVEGVDGDGRKLMTTLHTLASEPWTLAGLLQAAMVEAGGLMQQMMHSS